MAIVTSSESRKGLGRTGKVLVTDGGYGWRISVSGGQV